MQFEWCDLSSNKNHDTLIIIMIMAASANLLVWKSSPNSRSWMWRARLWWLPRILLGMGGGWGGVYECGGRSRPNFRGTAILASRFLPKWWRQGSCLRAPRPYQAHRICLCSLFEYHLNIIWLLSTHSGDINRKIPYALAPIS